MGNIKVKLKAKTGYFDFETGSSNLVNGELYTKAGFKNPNLEGITRVNGIYNFTFTTSKTKTKYSLNRYCTGSYGCELSGNSVYLRNIIVPTSKKYLKVTFNMLCTYTSALGDGANRTVLCGIYWVINDKNAFSGVFAGTDFVYTGKCRSTLCSGKASDLESYPKYEWFTVTTTIKNTQYQLFVNENLRHTVNFPDKATAINKGNNNLYRYNSTYNFGTEVPDNYNPWNHDNSMTYLSICFSIPHNGSNGTKVFIDNVSSYWSDNENDSIEVETNISSKSTTGLTITDNTNILKAFEFN